MTCNRSVIMDVLPRHVICVLGPWRDWSSVDALVRAFPYEFERDERYSRLSADNRMPDAFEASADRIRPSLTGEDRDGIRSHTAVAYILSPPLQAFLAEAISAQTLLLTAVLLQRGGGFAAKSESAGLAHGRDFWVELARNYLTHQDRDPHNAASTLYSAWVRRLIHDRSARAYYSCGMHLLGHRDTEVEDTLDPAAALEWADSLGLYLLADKPDRSVNDGEGFRLSDSGPRRIIRKVACERYEPDDFFFNPYGYHRLVTENQ